MDLLLGHNAEAATLNQAMGPRAKRQELGSSNSFEASLDSSASVLTVPARQMQAGGFERTASNSSVSTVSTRVAGAIPFAPQCSNIQRGSAGAKRDFASVKAGEDTPLKRVKDPASYQLRRQDSQTTQDTIQLADWGQVTAQEVKEDLRTRLQPDSAACSGAQNSADCSCTPPATLDSSSSCADLCCGESDVFSDRLHRSSLWPGSQRPPKATHTLHSYPQPDHSWKPPFELLEMVRTLFAAEDSTRPNPDYMQSHSRHTNPSLYIDPPMRSIAVSWLVEVACEYGLHQETLFLSTVLLDSFLTVSKAVPRSKLQLVSVACMLIAAKQEEEMYPSIADFTSIADHCFMEAELVQMESLVLQALKFRVCVPSTHTFLSIFRQVCKVSAKTLSLASYLTELAMLDYNLLRHGPSVVAHSALILAACTCSDARGLQQTVHLTELGCQQSADCLRDLQDLHHQAASALDVNNPLTAVKEKYRDSPWHCVAQLAPLLTLPSSAF